MIFSILIAHYNNFEYFKDCYQSIINQTFKDFEVIIVDDCSSDGSYEKVKDWVKNDPRFKVFQNEENKGVGYTKKRCIDLANGEFCGFLDPDDALLENAIECAVKSFDHHNIVATYSQYYECDAYLNIKNICKNSEKIKNNDKLFFNIFYEITHFFCFRKSAYQLTPKLDETLTSSIDQDLYLKLYEKGNFMFIKLPLYLYRIHSNGVSQNLKKKQKLRNNWNRVIKNTLDRRKITNLYGISINNIVDYAVFIYQNQNTIWKRILRRLK